MMGKVAYLCLQATREGQASHAHVHQIIRGLREIGWEVDLFEPDYAGKRRTPGYLGKIYSFLSVQWKMWRRASTADVLYIRSHHAALLTAVARAIQSLDRRCQSSAPVASMTRPKITARPAGGMRPDGVASVSRGPSGPGIGRDGDPMWAAMKRAQVTSGT